jgi:8-oxo-dGTP diphosphatase
MTTRPMDPETVSSHLWVSVACFRWNGERLETVVCPDHGLPSAVPASSESLDETAQRIVTETYGGSAAYMEQLYTFSARHHTDRETLVTYIALFAPEVQGSLPWQQLDQIRGLDRRDTTVLDYATLRLRAKLEYTSIVFHLMPPSFTIAELQHAYEAILGQPLDKRNFRRRMATNGMLVHTGEQRREGPHRPAALYRFSGQADRSSYLTPVNSREATLQRNDQ